MRKKQIIKCKAFIEEILDDVVLSKRYSVNLKYVWTIFDLENKSNMLKTQKKLVNERSNDVR